MPAQFDSFGVQFLYPDNWVVAERPDEESGSGVTLELPSGGFFSIEKDDSLLPDDELIERVVSAIAAEYDEVEREDIQIDQLGPEDRGLELRFYYLDLIVISRIVLTSRGDERLIIQMQAESRDYDANEQVFAAILQQIFS
ncbi:hypothetical protein [Stieleria varia]|uniref:DUF1795 domain-containing protein n=1 Tax=Stieleria varia TaxID=2528005 RepID=A0A5C6B1W6_9BACT|nr:hypothetical protein [Stieleria varia]TWU04384.1 hypothetical protein Pla52n_24240 [Stieleria varia]